MVHVVLMDPPPSAIDVISKADPSPSCVKKLAITRFAAVTETAGISNESPA
jgi:hypothetical protein